MATAHPGEPGLLRSAKTSSTAAGILSGLPWPETIWEYPIEKTSSQLIRNRMNVECLPRVGSILSSFAAPHNPANALLPARSGAKSQSSLVHSRNVDSDHSFCQFR